MKLDYLFVGQFKNLRDFKADFDENPNELFARSCSAATASARVTS